MDAWIEKIPLEEEMCTHYCVGHLGRIFVWAIVNRIAINIGADSLLMEKKKKNPNKWLLFLFKRLQASSNLKAAVLLFFSFSVRESGSQSLRGRLLLKLVSDGCPLCPSTTGFSSLLALRSYQEVPFLVCSHCRGPTAKPAFPLFNVCGR